MCGLQDEEEDFKLHGQCFCSLMPVFSFNYFSLTIGHSSAVSHHTQGTREQARYRGIMKIVMTLWNKRERGMSFESRSFQLSWHNIFRQIALDTNNFFFFLFLSFSLSLL